MPHIVARGTDRNQVCCRVELVGFADAGDRHEMMNVDEPLAYFAIGLFEIKATDSTATTFGCNTGFASLTTAFIMIKHNFMHLALGVFCNESPLPTSPKGEERQMRKTNN
jgi:hypothetical protein